MLILWLNMLSLPLPSAEISFKDLSSITFVAIVWRCLMKMQEEIPHADLGDQHSFDEATGVAGRHRVGSQLANTLKV
jgi:hypothetical protein